MLRTSKNNLYGLKSVFFGLNTIDDKKGFGYLFLIKLILEDFRLFAASLNSTEMGYIKIY